MLDSANFFKENSFQNLWPPFLSREDYYDLSIKITGSQGIYLTNDEEKKYINGFSGLSMTCGGDNQEIIAAITDQLHKLPYCSLFRTINEPALELAQLIASIMPYDLKHVLFTNSGADAVEASLKIARHYFRIKGKDKKIGFLSFDKSYHGTTYGAFSLSGIYKDSEHQFYGGKITSFNHIATPDCKNFPLQLTYPTCQIQCVEEIKKCISSIKDYDVAAIIVEPILGAGGVIEPPAEYFTILRTICDELDILLIADESATGFGRTGKMFAIERSNLKPDMIILSKAINSGYLPLGAVVVDSKIYKEINSSNVSKLIHGSSQSGNPICCAAGIAAIKYTQTHHLEKNAELMGKYLADLLKQIQACEFIKDIRCVGLMLVIELVDPADSSNMLDDNVMGLLYKKLLANGLIAHVKNNRLQIFPPLIITSEEIYNLFNIINVTLIEHLRKVS